MPSYEQGVEIASAQPHMARWATLPRRALERRRASLRFKFSDDARGLNVHNGACKSRRSSQSCGAIERWRFVYQSHLWLLSLEDGRKSLTLCMKDKSQPQSERDLGGVWLQQQLQSFLPNTLTPHRLHTLLRLKEVIGIALRRHYTKLHLQNARSSDDNWWGRRRCRHYRDGFEDYKVPFRSTNEIHGSGIVHPTVD